MPRQARHDAPGTLHHVIVRGPLGTLLTSLTYCFILLVIALEMADVDTPRCRATSANSVPHVS